MSLLIYVMGIEAEKIFASCEFAAEEEKMDYDFVLKKYEDYFVLRCNIIHERTCFYQRNQQPGETVEMYIRTLYKMVEHCEFRNKRDKHIRDRLVVRIKEK